MAKVLLYTVDVDVAGRPIGGGMLRVRQLSRLLRGLGHEVTVSMPLEAVLASGGAGEIVEVAYDTHDPSRLALDLNPDIVICAQWHLVPALGAIESPLWLDLHGSLLAENAFRHQGGSESAARYGQEVLAKLAAFGRADVVTCTGARQRLYFRGWRAISGGTYNDWEVVHLPLAIEPEPELPEPSVRKGLRYLFAGNLWPWIDLGSWLPEFFSAVAERVDDEVHFFVDDPVDRRDGREIITGAGGGPGYERLVEEGRLVVTGRLGHAAYRKTAREYDVALDLFGPNLEREIAVTTRTLEYLAFGIPVLYPQHAELSGLIEDYGCGWVLDPAQPGAIRSFLAGIDEENIRSRVIAACTTTALEMLEKEAVSRCEGAVERALATAVGGRALGGERRFEARLGADVVEDLRTARRRFSREHETAIRLERELLECKQAGDHREQDFERRIKGRGETIRRLESVAEAEQKRVRELEIAVSDAEACARDLQREVLSKEEHLEELEKNGQAQICALQGELFEEKKRREANDLNAARQVALTLRTAVPHLGRRGLGRRLRLLRLYVDHIVTRFYLAFWQRIRQQRIFPGM